MIATTNMGATFISNSVVEKMPMHENMTYYKINSEHAQRDVYFFFKKNKYNIRY